jgi:hypothetical protein
VESERNDARKAVADARALVKELRTPALAVLMQIVSDPASRQSERKRALRLLAKRV